MWENTFARKAVSWNHRDFVYLVDFWIVASATDPRAKHHQHLLYGSKDSSADTQAASPAGERAPWAPGDRHWPPTLFPSALGSAHWDTAQHLGSLLHNTQSPMLSAGGVVIRTNSTYRGQLLQGKMLLQLNPNRQRQC